MLLLQSFILIGGTLFACSTVASDFIRFSNNQAVNPIYTPCFYGAIGFLVAYFYSLYIFFLPQLKKLKQQKFLLYFLIGGTLFGWGNFVLELCRFYIFKNPTSCSGSIASTPFLTPCFFGSVIYLLSLIAAFITYRQLSRKQTKTF